MNGVWEAAQRVVSSRLFRIVAMVLVLFVLAVFGWGLRLHHGG